MLCRPTLLVAILWLSIQTISAETRFAAFWNKFRSAAVRSDQPAIAEMTKFPFSFYSSHIKGRAEFLRRYGEIFKGEADAAKCFAGAEPRKDSARSYSVYCSFKETPNDRENAPIRFIFELTGSGWKFAGLDNINE